MAVTKLSNLSVTSGRSYSSLLAGNPTYIASSYESIATANGTGSSGTITFSSIPSTFKHLQVRGIMRSTEAGATTTNCYITLNGVTTSSYARHHLSGNGTAASASGAASQTFTFPGNATGAASTSGVMATLIFDLLDYTSTSKNKTLRFFSGHDQNGSGEIRVASGIYLSTNAVSSIEIKTSSNNWSTDTTFALYGIKEA
jgi:hypothetical protein